MKGGRLSKSNLRQNNLTYIGTYIKKARRLLVGANCIKEMQDEEKGRGVERGKACTLYFSVPAIKRLHERCVVVSVASVLRRQSSASINVLCAM